MQPFPEPYVVIGSRGMLGADLVRLLRQCGCATEALTSDDVDITDQVSVSRAFGKWTPGTVLNMAALTDVDGCESMPERAFAVNAQGPAHLARACKEWSAVLVHMSTDYVFDGSKEAPYVEDDPINPLGVYAKSKAEGELLVREILPEHSCVVRTQWLYGSHGKNFVATVLKMATQGQALRVVNDQYGSPTYTPDLAAALIHLCRRAALGLFHVTNSGWTTWFGFAKRILERAGLTSVRLEPISSRELNRPSPRPAHAVLDNARFMATVGGPLRHWEEALDDYLTQRALSMATGELQPVDS